MPYYKGRPYIPIPPCPDDGGLADTGDRLMLRHHRDHDPELFVAPHGVITAGWVIGIFQADNPQGEHDAP
jgi:hypothetical protein